MYINAKLFTLQEYKKLGGYITEKIPGETVYHISVLDGEPAVTNFVYKTNITCTMSNKTGWGFDSRYKSHELTLESDYPVPENIICYTIKKNAPPRDISDGTLYYWNEPLAQNMPINRIVRTMKDEFLKVFVKDEVYYGIIQA